MARRRSKRELELVRMAEAGDREAMHALGEWMLEQFDDDHYHELLDPASLPLPLSAEQVLILEQQARLTKKERARLLDQRALRDEGLRWLRAASEKDDAEACVVLADFLSRSGDEALRAEALRWYERAARLGDILSMATLGSHLKQGWGAPANPTLAREWYAQAAAGFEAAVKRDDAFAPAAMSALAQQLLEGDGLPPDPERAVALLEEAASRGYHWALLRLGEAYEHGRGVARDLELARRAYERAVAAGVDPYAKLRLDHLERARLESLTTTPIGEAHVPTDLLRAAEAGDPQKMWEVARALGDEAEFEAAVHWTQRAAEAGHALAAFMMAFEVKADEEKARWRRRAAGLGHVTALHMLGDSWLETEQGAADPAYGYAWIELATRERYGEPAALAATHKAQARARAADVWESMTAEQRERASDILRRCDAGPPYRLPDELSEPSDSA
jgi:TPR repeat protein